MSSSTGRTEKEQVRVHIRWMIRRDMPEVIQTEQASFDFSWTEEDFSPLSAAAATASAWWPSRGESRRLSDL